MDTNIVLNAQTVVNVFNTMKLYHRLVEVPITVSQNLKSLDIL